MQSVMRFLLVVGMGCFAGTSIAEQSAASAERLFWKGRDEVKKGHVAQALEFFVQSQQLESSTRTELNIADCEEKLGKVVSPWKRYRKLLAINSTNWKHAQYVEEKAAEVERRIARLYINLLPLQPRGFTIRLDGEKLESIGPQKPIFVDPGSHTVEVSAPGYHDVVRHVTLKEGEFLYIPPVVLESTRVAEEKRRPKVPLSATTSVVFTAMSAGGLILASGAGLLIDGSMTNKEGETVFNESSSPKEFGATNTVLAWNGIGRANAGRDYVWKGAIVAGVGGAVSVVGLGLFLWTRKTSRKMPADISVSLSPSSAGASIGWSF